MEDIKTSAAKEIKQEEQKLVCKYCGSEETIIDLDSRGVPEVRCAHCNSYIAKSNNLKYSEYLKHKEDNKPQCKYCTERWAILTGRVGTQPRPMNDIKFCPMCGRELKPEDKKY